MVLLTKILRFAKERKAPRAYLKSRFLDSLRIYAKGGFGGTGLPKYGGVGGQGGCVYCVGKEGKSLKNVVTKFPSKKIVAGSGEDSVKNKILGAPGVDKTLEVPLGVTVYREDGKKLGEINTEGETCILARGGPGGGPKNNYLGHDGQSYSVRLDLRLIADVGLVGFPNAGKSSLLKTLSRAKPKIANYPFTTIKPNLGVIQYEDKRQITVADLPGLIEGAHINIGLGHKFLKHVERTKLLLLVVDIKGFSLSQMHSYRSCIETILLLNKELELYNSELLEKPAILAINKIDLEGAEDDFERVRDQLSNLENTVKNIRHEIVPEKFLKFDDIISISALQGQSIGDLKKLIRVNLDDHALKNDPAVISGSDLAKQLRKSVAEHGPKIT